MLLRGGKGFAAALGLAAIGGPGRRDLLNLLLPRAPLPNLAGAHLIAFEPELEAEAEAALTYVPAVDTCVLTCGLTLGPCYSAAGALTRRDISAGATGLPARLAFRIIYVDTCQPVTNATVDVWHTNASGIYSALTAQVCTTGANVANQTFCRGVQPTDSDGMVYFDTVYPGWYSSRTTHIHTTIRINGTEYATAQFPFADRVSDFIYRKHPL